MIRLVFVILFISPIFSCAQSPKVPIWDENAFNSYVQRDKKNLKLIHFWATWCVPCVKELPVFEKVSEAFQNQIDVLLVSLDFADQLETRLLPFIKKRGLVNQVVLLDPSDENKWIESVDSNWEGNLPATLIVYRGEKYFFPHGFQYLELKSNLLKIMNHEK